MRLVDNEAQRMGSSPEIPDIPLLARDRRSLEEAYEAYQVFCENGSHRIAWRNLALFLTTYLKPYFARPFNGAFRVPSNPERVEYLAALHIKQLGYLTRDVLWVVFRSTGFIDNDDDLRKAEYDFPGLHIPRKYVAKLPQVALQVLLAEITNELNKRTPLSSYWHGRSIASLSTNWTPTSGAESGILHHLDVDITTDDVWLLHRLDNKHELDSKPTLYDYPKKLLRRAFSVGSSGPSRGQLVRRRVDDGFFGDLVPRAYTDRLRDVVMPRFDIASLASAADLDHTTRKVTDTLSSELKPKLEPTRPPDIATPVTPRLLDAILEETEEERKEWEGTYEGSVWSDNDSVHTSQTLDSLLDFYANGFTSRNASSKSLHLPPKRFSVDVAELGRPEFKERLSLARKLFDDASSIGRKSNVSNFSEHHSFITARTRMSVTTTSRVSKQSSVESFTSVQTTSSLTEETLAHSAYLQMLKERDLLPTSVMETDWSGRGQHAEFSDEERALIPLQAEKVLGQTRNALVESVRCKRVRLVRKIMRCTKWTGLKREDALCEVQHLYRIQHSHIVRLVGTYVIGAELAILTYPCAEWNLEQFMRATSSSSDVPDRCASLRQFFTCLAKVLDFMHSFPLKHMDIKPQNLLVRDVRKSVVNDSDPYKIYFTDFGISRSYPSVEESETETPTSFTRAYAALEVVLQESRGLSADIFSLGCVFAEMLATLLDLLTPAKSTTEEDKSAYWSSLRAARENTEGGVRPYHACVEEVCSWLSELPLLEPELQAIRGWILDMLDNDPSKRPTARQIADDPHLPFACSSCMLRTGPENFEAAEPLEPPHGSPHTSISSAEMPKPP